MGRIRNLLVTMPPRHGKSQLISKWTPAWYLKRFPSNRVILSSYEADFAASWGRQVRNILIDNVDRLGIGIADDSSAANRWDTTAGGGMITAGVGGGITGRGGNFIIVDDPIKNAEQAYSATFRDKVWDWWESTLMTRREPGGGIVLVHTRWHEDDVAGRVMAKDLELPPEKRDWVHLDLPAIAVANDPMGRAMGAALWPERYSVEELERIKRSVGMYVWSALFQQKPPSTMGGLLYHAFRADTPPIGNLDPNVQLDFNLDLHLSVDFNIDPGCHAIIGQRDHATGIITAVHEIHEPAMHAKMLGKRFVEWAHANGGFVNGKFRWPELWMFGDASGRSRTSATGQTAWDMVIGEIEAAGIPWRLKVLDANPPVAERVDHVNNQLQGVDGSRNYRIHPRCERLVIDMKRMKWDGNESNKRDQKISHASEADGYRIHYLTPMGTLAESGTSAPVVFGVRA